MKRTIQITDFRFRVADYGKYYVTYTSPVTGKRWARHITDMQLIDATKNSDNPKIKDLNLLKYRCKL